MTCEGSFNMRPHPDVGEGASLHWPSQCRLFFARKPDRESEQLYRHPATFTGRRWMRLRLDRSFLRKQPAATAPDRP